MALHVMVPVTYASVSCYRIDRIGEIETPIGWAVYDPNTSWGWKYTDDPETDPWRFNTDPVFDNPEQAIEKLEEHES